MGMAWRPHWVLRSSQTRLECSLQGIWTQNGQVSGLHGTLGHLQRWFPSLQRVPDNMISLSKTLKKIAFLTIFMGYSKAKWRKWLRTKRYLKLGKMEEEGFIIIWVQPERPKSRFQCQYIGKTSLCAFATIQAAKRSRITLFRCSILHVVVCLHCPKCEALWAHLGDHLGCLHLAKFDSKQLCSGLNRKRPSFGPPEDFGAPSEVVSWPSKGARQHGITFEDFEKIAFLTIFMGYSKAKWQKWLRTKRHLKLGEVEAEGFTIIRVRPGCPKTQFQSLYIGKFSLCRFANVRAAKPSQSTLFR